MPITQISPVILTLDDAATATAAGVHKATELGVPCTFSVLDGGGNTVLVTRMDGAALASIDISGAKARTAVYFGAATADLAPAVQSGAPLSSIQTATTLPLAFVAGGIPITDACGVVVGALGAGGGSPAQDHEVAAFAVQALRGP